jgi:ankyrin repeat protein
MNQQFQQQQHEQQNQQLQLQNQALHQENQALQQQVAQLQQHGDNIDDDAPQAIVPQQEEEPDGQQQDENDEDEEPPPVISDEMKHAVAAGDTGEIIKLLDAGESPNCVDSRGNTPVIRGLSEGQLACAKVLLGWGADLSKLNTDDGSNVLHAAAVGGSLDCINWVFSNTTLDINYTDDEGRTPTMVALQHGQLEATKALFARGADLSIIDSNGSTVLHHAAVSGCLGCIKWV